jgi:hypothetical protein
MRSDDEEIKLKGHLARSLSLSQNINNYLLYYDACATLERRDDDEEEVLAEDET